MFQANEINLNIDLSHQCSRSLPKFEKPAIYSRLVPAKQTGRFSGRKLMGTCLQDPFRKEMKETGLGGEVGMGCSVNTSSYKKQAWPFRFVLNWAKGAQ